MQDFPKKQCIDSYKNHHDPLEVCGGVFICRDSGLCLYFLIFLLICCVLDVSGCQPLSSGCVANNSTQGLRSGLVALWPSYITVSISLLSSAPLSVSVSWMYKELQVCVSAWLRAGLSYTHAEQRGHSGQDKALHSHNAMQCCTFPQGCVEVWVCLFLL